MNAGTVLLLAACAGAAWVSWRRGAWSYALGWAVLALLPAGTLLRAVSWPGVIAAALLLAPFVWQRLARTSATVARWGARSRRKDGVASTLDIARVGSGWAMRRTAATVRPSLAVPGRGWRARWARLRQLWRLPTAQVAVQLCRVGWLRVWASVEDVVLVFGGPRTGKTQWLAGRILDAPGAVVVTSTRTEVPRCSRTTI